MITVEEKETNSKVKVSWVSVETTTPDGSIQLAIHRYGASYLGEEELIIDLGRGDAEQALKRVVTNANLQALSLAVEDFESTARDYMAAQKEQAQNDDALSEARPVRRIATRAWEKACALLTGRPQGQDKVGMLRLAALDKAATVDNILTRLGVEGPGNEDMLEAFTDDGTISKRLEARLQFDRFKYPYQLGLIEVRGEDGSCTIFSEPNADPWIKGVSIAKICNNPAEKHDYMKQIDGMGSSIQLLWAVSAEYVRRGEAQGMSPEDMLEAAPYQDLNKISRDDAIPHEEFMKMLESGTFPGQDSRGKNERSVISPMLVSLNENLNHYTKQFGGEQQDITRRMRAFLEVTRRDLEQDNTGPVHSAPAPTREP